MTRPRNGLQRAEARSRTAEKRAADGGYFFLMADSVIAANAGQETPDGLIYASFNLVAALISYPVPPGMWIAAPPNVIRVVIGARWHPE